MDASARWELLLCTWVLFPTCLRSGDESTLYKAGAIRICRFHARALPSETGVAVGEIAPDQASGLLSASCARRGRDWLTHLDRELHMCTSIWQLLGLASGLAVVVGGLVSGSQRWGAKRCLGVLSLSAELIGLQGSSCLIKWTIFCGLIIRCDTL